MSCDDCNDLPIHGAYLRFGNSEIGYGNVEVVACAKHWKAVRDVLCRAEPVLTEEEREALGAACGALAYDGYIATIRALLARTDPNR